MTRPLAAVRKLLGSGLVIPAHPLALDSSRRLDERRQRALSRYYLAAGAGALAVGVHNTQFAIRSPEHALLRPVLELAVEEIERANRNRDTPALAIGGICGDTRQAMDEAGLLSELGYDAGLICLAALREAADEALLTHCRTAAGVIPIIGFYLQPAVGGRALSYSFWRRFCDIENVVAIKIAPFNRYQTQDVVRAVAESGREDIALYTGNDDNIVADLLMPFRFPVCGEMAERRMVGGLLGHWAVWTRRAVDLMEEIKAATAAGRVDAELFAAAAAITDCNSAFFDAAHGFAGCIAGLHEVLRRQRLLQGVWCLDPAEGLSPGQTEEIDRVLAAYPHLGDDEFVAAHRDEWLSG